MSEVIKSISDKRSFKALRLSNGLEVLLVSDQDAQKSAAALSVGVGSFSDPFEAQGLAHYLEHMLFMGTQRYPEENEYSNFLTKNAGSSNAYTSLEETNYYFEVSHASFFGALDRFSRFFIDPLMLDSSSERELNAVHSQHSKNLQSDVWRKYQLSKYLAKPGHPYNKFSTGDRSSLANPNLREMLFNFYKSNYSSNLMKLVVYGKEDVETLTKEVQSRFSEVVNNSYPKYQLPEQPFGEKLFGKLVKLVPVKDRRTLELTWIINNHANEYKFSPSKYVSHILGHEGKGSLLSFLISQGLATALSAGGSDSYQTYSEFEINVTLTDKGVQQIRQIIGYVVYFINLLKETPPQEWVIDEIKRINKMKFDFLEKRQGMNFCSSTAKNMHKREVEEIMIYPYFMEEFRPDLITAYLSELKFDNLIVFAESKTFEPVCTETEPIYQSKYITEPLGEITPLTCNVTLPEHNTFIPDDLSVLPLGKEIHPKKLFESEFIQAFYKEDHEFKLPKAEIDIRIYFGGQNTVRQEVVRSLFEKMLKEKLREFVYVAEIAELESEFSFSSYFTLNLKITGFRDSFDRFTNQYLSEILGFVPDDQQLFDNIKEKQKKEYANYFLNNPYQIAYNSIVNALREGSSTSPSAKLTQIDNIILSDLAAYAKYWKTSLYLEFYMTGNLKEEQASRIAKDVEDYIKKHSSKLDKSVVGTIRAVSLPINHVCAVEEVLKSADEKNSSIIVHYQYEKLNVGNKILQDLALAFVKEPAFDYLRTKEQLGYIVMCLPDDHRGVLGLSILVQSSVKNSYELQQYVKKFVNEVLKEKIDGLDEKTFEEYKAALENTKIQKDKTLSAEASRFWGEIVKHSYEFTRKEQQIEAVPKITLAEFKQYLSKVFYQNTRVFEIHQISQNTLESSKQLRDERLKTDSSFKIFSDIPTFRKKMSLYPDYYSHL